MTINRSLIHKSAQAEVLITSVEPAGDDSWLCGIEVPRGHWRNHPEPLELPLVLGAELVRQSGMAVCTLGYDVPPESAFTVQELEFAWVGDIPQFPRFGPLKTNVQIKVSDQVNRKGILSGLNLNYSFGGFAAAHAVTRVLSQKDYAVVRRNAVAPGATAPRYDVGVIREFDGRAGLVGWNESDPFFFDHAVDHVPGMLLIDVALQAFERVKRYGASRIRVSFDQFAELTSDTAFEITLDTDAVTVQFAQNGLPIATATLN